MIKLLFFLLFIVYMGWILFKLWKGNDKKNFYLVTGIGTIATYLLIANRVDLPTVNLLQDLENITYPLGIWLQKALGITYLD